jgi:hypothetical protein
MKQLLVSLLTCAALTYAADQQPQAAKMPPDGGAGGTGAYKKLGALTWDPDTRKLAWTVETGSMVEGKFVAASKKRYEITPDDATMATATEKRSFDNDEAVALHHLLDILSLYCAESAVWWDQGPGSPTDSKPEGSEKPTSGKPVRVNQPSAPSTPAPPARLAHGTAVAELP